MPRSKFNKYLLSISFLTLLLFFAQNSANAQTALEQQCYNAVQGKVAWNQAGTTNWSEANIRSLCKGTTNPSATISCFQAQIKQHNNWITAISNCQPSVRPQATVKTDRRIVAEPKVVSVEKDGLPIVDDKNSADSGMITRTITIKNNSGLSLSAQLIAVDSYSNPNDVNTGLRTTNEFGLNQTKTIGGDASFLLNQDIELWIRNSDNLKPLFKVDLPKNKNLTTFCYEVSGTFFVLSVKTCDGSPTYESKYISYKNEAGFNANMSLSYYPKGGSTIKTATTETTTAGFQRKVYLPLDADTTKQMTLKIELLGAGSNRTLLSRDVNAAAFSSSGSTCYKNWGTVFSPKTSPCSISGSARTIKLKNNAGYPASMVVTYYDKDQTGKDLGTTVFTNTIEVLQSESIEIPQGTSPTPIKIDFSNKWNSGKVFATMNASAKFTGELCYKIEGTTFAPTAATCDDTVGDTSGDTRQIRFQNDSGYDAQMLVTYMEDQAIGGTKVTMPKPIAIATGYINGLGGKFRMVTIPKNTTKGQPITIYLQGKATVKGNDAIFTTTLPADFAGSPQPCFKVTGTLFDPSGGKCNQ